MKTLVNYYDHLSSNRKILPAIEKKSKNHLSFGQEEHIKNNFAGYQTFTGLHQNLIKYI